MEINMKKSLRALVIALFLPAITDAQVTYFLPATGFEVEVTAVKENYIAGPYARYARKYLGIEVPVVDHSVTTITEIKVTATAMADLSSPSYTLPWWHSDDKFLALTTQGLVALENKENASDNKWLGNSSTPEAEVLYSALAPDAAYSAGPIPWEVAPDKPQEYLAKDAAEIILTARRERYNIAIGNTDATFSGEALGAALGELDRIENDYLPLFTGHKTVETQHITVSVLPQAGSKEQRISLFAVSPEDGLVVNGTGEDTVYYLDVVKVLSSDPGIVPATGKESKNVIHYRIPAVCDLKLTDGESVLFIKRAAVYQLGREFTCPAR